MLPKTEKEKVEEPADLTDFERRREVKKKKNRAIGWRVNAYIHIAHAGLSHFVLRFFKVNQNLRSESASEVCRLEAVELR